MQVVGTQGLSEQQIGDELHRGAKFVIYQILYLHSNLDL